MNEITCINFKSFTKGCLLGFADIYVPKWGVEIYSISLFQKNGHRWVSFPSKEYKDEKGETKYSQFMRFKEKDHSDAFGDVVMKAIDKFCLEDQSKAPESKEEDPLDLFGL